jgi:hypothetical protein
MSVGDIRGSRRRFKARIAAGHAPRPGQSSVAQSIDREKRKAMRIAAASKKK